MRENPIWAKQIFQDTLGLGRSRLSVPNKCPLLKVQLYWHEFESWLRLEAFGKILASPSVGRKIEIIKGLGIHSTVVRTVGLIDKLIAKISLSCRLNFKSGHASAGHAFQQTLTSETETSINLKVFFVAAVAQLSTSSEFGWRRIRNSWLVITAEAKLVASCFSCLVDYSTSVE